MAEEKTETPTHAPPKNNEEFKKRYGDLIGLGQSAAVYARNGIAAKVYRENQPHYQPFMEAFYIALVGEMNIPVPKIYAVESFLNQTAIVMDQVKGKSLYDIAIEDPSRIEETLDTVVEMQIGMHKVQIGVFRSLKNVLGANIAVSPGLTPDEKDRLNAMLAKLPDGLAICHGDFHGGNILFDGEKYIIIDWAEVACGAPAGDACRTYMDYYMGNREIAEAYLKKYCAASGLTSEEILAWLPVTAGSIYGFMTDEWKKQIRHLF
ncbi:aminoglycoside phosphotransferase family protein [Methanoregula formicica]|uniref:Putative aminoglycoside phosphotransferase n=1 Tax=Methanoregula formicica (strain DSM 22288 / NBRC 105244 / SMSP) TaxID=593750 RepID=L0HDN9_METFS|nr:aminoglycoside phosphotransferase family protein [Methanoregula formicica]AGB02842.1 putative aminoglycoside phosphotransferase [Methanoregula formicica SMSP]